MALAGLLLGGGRLWPGVWIGSFAVNVSTSWDASTLPALLRSLAIAGSIASGAALQAWVGARLIRSRVGFHNIFTQEVDVVRMLLLGGPLSCVINAMASVTTLRLAGLIPGSNFLFSLWTWWVGDSIGVLIFMPLICAWSLPRQTWLRKQVMLTLPLAAMFALVVLLFFTVSNREQVRLRAEFEHTAQQVSEDLRARVDSDLTILEAAGSFFESSAAATRREFRYFVDDQLRSHPDIRALDWVARVTRAGRPAYEAMMRADGAGPGYIWERDTQGRAVSASDRDEYFSITYIEPMATNASALGFDLISEQNRHDAVRHAMASRAITASRRVRLVQDQTGEWGLIIVRPVYRQDLYPDSSALPVGSLMGVCLAVLRMPDVVRASMKHLGDSGVTLRLEDVTGGAAEALFRSGPELPSSAVAFSRTTAIDIAERRWALTLELPNDYLVAHRSWQAWGLLAVGLFITGLLGTLILVLIGRQAKVEEMVRSQTAGLSAVARELERSNAELEQFAYVASHDLQAPLRSIVGFGQLLRKDYHGRLDQDADTYIDFMVKSANQMQSLIRGLLEFSRIGRGPSGHATADCERVLAEVLERLDALVRERGAEVTHEPLPVLACAPVELGQLLQNLIGNALKFQAPGVQPRVHLSAQRDGADWRIGVRDNGIGIDPKYQERIFQMFQRLHTADRYEGTGIGLAICRKIVQRHGGTLWVESVSGQGACFRFTLPAA